MSAVSLATSVPVMPMATAILARLMAGASLTPSPVMATTSPLACRASTMRILCSGEIQRPIHDAGVRALDLGGVDHLAEDPAIGLYFPACSAEIDPKVVVGTVSKVQPVAVEALPQPVASQLQHVLAGGAGCQVDFGQLPDVEIALVLVRPFLPGVPIMVGAV